MKTGSGVFEILACDADTLARAGRLQTAHGCVMTPAFMPVGTQGSVKTMTPWELEQSGTEIVLGNTYHLSIRPGTEVVAAAGGLHRFMGWDHPILTDSGGFQVFSLSGLRKIHEAGVEFNSHIDGRRVFLGPVEAMEIQRILASDIAMVFDECPPYSCGKDYTCQAVDRTLKWAAICLEQPRAPGQLVFGIVQGGGYLDLREGCARALVALGFDGYAIGGVSVGEPEEVLLRAMQHSVNLLPVEKPRYLMGVGDMGQIVEAVANGVDMFDCVMPTRLGRNGTAFTRYGRYPVKAGKYRFDTRPVEEGCACYTCRTFPRSYVRHLLNVGEILGVRLLTLHNVHRYMTFMEEIRAAIRERRFAAFRKEFATCRQPPAYAQ